ncbi:uncharacterized protein LOC114760890 [Neltuma alba]|uniref:uncharacterized protein LOC114754247 n=1 Tax=Neltuma alba TaxID=207710 RepID=UPI0010A4FB93|nr:uncharacterized protein LOC114754247 [Prosopis alba]XP_028806036.1 uncharacterized protein LOC114760890 [Prosopis alba]
MEFNSWVEVDGAFSCLSKAAACGGIIKGIHGNILEGFQLKLESRDALTAELWACIMGLKRVWDKSYRNILLRSDSQEALNLLHNKPPDLREDYMLIKEVQEMIKRDWRVELRYIQREQNTLADILAKRALEGSTGLLLLHPDSHESGLLSQGTEFYFI